MSINRPIKASGLQPAGVPAPGGGFWTQPVGQLAPGVDVGCTKIAIDLLSLTHDTLRAGLPQALRDLRAAAHVDAAFLVLFDEAGSAFESVRVERSDYSNCRLERLQHLKLTDLPHIASRSAHLRITEIADTTHPLREQMADTPRLAAMMIMTPLLSFDTCMIGTLGGGLIGMTQRNVPWSQYMSAALEFARAKELFVGLLKALLYGMIITAVSCHEGLTATQGAVGVGQATRRSVIISFLLVLVVGYFVTRFFY